MNRSGHIFRQPRRTPGTTNIATTIARGKMMINTGIFLHDFQTNRGLDAGWKNVEGSNFIVWMEIKLEDQPLDVIKISLQASPLDLLRKFGFISSFHPLGRLPHESNNWSVYHSQPMITVAVSRSPWSQPFLRPPLGQVESEECWGLPNTSKS